MSKFWKMKGYISSQSAGVDSEDGLIMTHKFYDIAVNMDLVSSIATCENASGLDLVNLYAANETIITTVCGTIDGILQGLSYE